MHKKHTPSTTATRLRFGPYAMPSGYGVGESIECKARGRDVVIASITDSLIQWFSTRKSGYPILILCGDLIRAVRLESTSAVAHHWNVTTDTVASWRRALEIGRMTPGTTSVWRESMPTRMGQADIERGRHKSRGKAAHSKMVASKQGKPMHQNTRKALLAAAKRPKTDEHRDAISKALKAKGIQPPNIVGWREEEDMRLGKAEDSVVATELGRSAEAVRKRRMRLGVPPFRRKHASDAENP